MGMRFFDFYPFRFMIDFELGYQNFEGYMDKHKRQIELITEFLQEAVGNEVVSLQVGYLTQPITSERLNTTKGKIIGIGLPNFDYNNKTKVFTDKLNIIVDAISVLLEKPERLRALHDRTRLRTPQKRSGHRRPALPAIHLRRHRNRDVGDAHLLRTQGPQEPEIGSGS